MEVKDPSHGSDLEKPSNGSELELDSSCSTPYVSAPSSPGRGPVPSYFYSAPASPMHYILSSIPYSSSPSSETDVEASISGAGSFEFEFSSRGSMISADELFLNGQIRPMRLASHLQRPQALAPLLDLEDDDDDELRCPVAPGARGRDLRLRSGSIHRRARSLSPLRNPRLPWTEDDDEPERVPANRASDLETDPDPKQIEEPTPSSGSTSSSRSSSSGRNSKRWIFLKDLLYRSKSEGRGNGKEKEKFWLSISFSPSKEKEKPKPSPAVSSPAPATKRAAPPSARRPSAHERHYTAKRAQAEEMRRRTFLPYRQGLLGCLGISSRGYGAVSGLAKTLNPLSSR
ncbi:hypothetical protein J5N97_017550 [Dioscorea zingiberensis]|uniref:Calmodulin-binding protein n=1 Tax=Dioscorea zingiberensis TaxID=325984 RepID=A0A9D5HGH3_9LILI|nr:hypothetical protein J5N97_017550 [Dioscorea zingiberensis]